MPLDQYNSSGEIAAAQPQIAVWGIGAIEQHGRHLPVGTDWIAVKELARRVALELDAFLVPSIPFSLSECHGMLPGTVWLQPATLAAVVGDVVRSLQVQGIHKLLIINGHGGNFILEAVIRTLNSELADMRIIMPPGIFAVRDEAGPIFETADTEIHAGEIETSIQLFLNLQHVKDERSGFVPDLGQEFLDYATMDQINPEGVWGQPETGTADKGRRALAARVKEVAAYARNAFEALK
jgi:creatinine amidohydrolase